MDILGKLLGGSSIWCKSLIYDLDERKLIISLVDDPVSMNVSRELIFSEITNFYETIEEFENDSIDSLMGIHWLEDAATICIKTEKREILVKTTTEPYAERII